MLHPDEQGTAIAVDTYCDVVYAFFSEVLQVVQKSVFFSFLELIISSLSKSLIKFSEKCMSSLDQILLQVLK